MPYFVKWIRADDGALLDPQIAHATMDMAYSNACATLLTKPRDIWIEDERGMQFADHAGILKHRADAGKVSN